MGSIAQAQNMTIILVIPAQLHVMEAVNHPRVMEQILTAHQAEALTHVAKTLSVQADINAAIINA